MSIQILGTGSATMTTLSASLDRLNTQSATLSGELSSGIVSDSYSGLGAERYQALSLQPEITQIGAWQQNITTTQNSLSVAQTALSGISSIVSELQTTLTGLQGTRDTAGITAASTQAKQALAALASYANTQNGDSYVFGGTLSGSAPITDPANILSSSTVSTIAASVAQVGTIGAGAVESAAVAAASDNAAGQSLFSPSLSVDGVSAASQARSTMVGSGDTITTGFVLTQGTAATASSTGSPIRDLVGALSIVAALPEADASSPELSTLIDDTLGGVKQIGASLTQSESAIGQTQDDLTARASGLSTVSTALTEQLKDLKGADAATLSTQISSVKDQISASYGLIADMKGMTLAAYL